MIIRKNFDGKDKVIGELEGNVFSKTVSKAKHLFKTTDSWGIDYQTYEDVLLPENSTIKIHDTDENKDYTTDAEQYRLYGKVMQFKGFGLQIFLPRKYFS